MAHTVFIICINHKLTKIITLIIFCSRIQRSVPLPLYRKSVRDQLRESNRWESRIFQVTAVQQMIASNKSGNRIANR
uniref:Putative secreted peptide n=1 Tax=Anopheles braziliensis TaxID=58242 RepID=A0A2M3ZVF6_9DIPT